MRNANYWIQNLNLQPHPEGGFFKEIYRSTEVIKNKSLPQRFCGNRSFSTSIYFLLNKTDFCAFHKIKQDELWHFYDGISLTIHIIDKDFNYSTQQLGKDIKKHQRPQVIVPAGYWFAAEINDKKHFGLCGCTVAPGFDLADFTMPTQNELIALMPQHIKIIKKFSRLQNKIFV